eukprot:CAMPEP_0184326308 /NCGR_PEP_ID=MMETSP1049-20130417/142495_1 /TAXON_ID=77928 /ORGANISM="Proteomonas sulcata, Strain CCMP704" /LENGTH=86 /DNA_ID=CAMNT_0026648495 /DNA_START=361 /DNA_END=621 /DNA_ORIENTATION=-
MIPVHPDRPLISMLLKLIVPRFNSLDCATDGGYECPTGTHGFYDAPASYNDLVTGTYGMTIGPFENAGPEYTPGEGYAMIPVHPDM